MRQVQNGLKFRVFEAEQSALKKRTFLRISLLVIF